ncbi:MAG: hypothetical protein RQ826_16250, partial [Xanthomonadales bacterium]|nr:hypothetical protein [Xanthomonadales bacterium]
LADFEAVLGGDREMALCREMTKQFETVLRGSVAAVRARVEADADQRKGEFVLLLSGCGTSGESSLPEALELARALQEYMGASQAARVAAKIHGLSRRDLYAALEGWPET